MLLTGAKGFEPPDVGTKTRCLTTWRRPIASQLLILASPTLDLSRVFAKNFSLFLNNSLKPLIYKPFSYFSIDVHFQHKAK